MPDRVFRPQFNAANMKLARQRRGDPRHLVSPCNSLCCSSLVNELEYLEQPEALSITASKTVLPDAISRLPSASLPRPP